MQDEQQISGSDYGFVALLDVLGFGRLTDEEMTRVVVQLEQCNDEILPQIFELLSEEKKRWMQKPKVTLFSDTIIMAFPRVPKSYISQDIFHFINDCVGQLFCLLLSEGIKLRGAIGYGTILQRKHIIYGRAILDARAEYEETSWAGVHYSHHAGYYAAKWCEWSINNGSKDRRMLPGTDHRLNKCQFSVAPIPFKPNCKFPEEMPEALRKSRFVVPWPKDYRTIVDFQRAVALDTSSIHTLVHAILDPDLAIDDQHVREIIGHTLAYFDAYIKEFPGVNSQLPPPTPFPGFS